MLMIIEIILTVAAWKKGWKAIALLPMGIAILIGFFTGIAVGASGGSSDALLVLMFFVELVGIVVLATMSKKGPAMKTQKDNIPKIEHAEMPEAQPDLS